MQSLTASQTHTLSLTGYTRRIHSPSISGKKFIGSDRKLRQGRITILGYVDSRAHSLLILWISK